LRALSAKLNEEDINFDLLNLNLVELNLKSKLDWGG